MIRKKFVVLTPEEWVRQNFLMYLIFHRNYPASLVSVETELKLFKKKKRTDIVVHSNLGKPLMIIECKAPGIKIDESVFEQVIRYNMALKVNHLILTNGLSHFCCTVDYQRNAVEFLKDVPDYKNILTFGE
ncbi:MAG: type I restriction enzyme HsdR N-terminal domain-containing protein [Bacteroidales bacterium]